MKKFLFVLLAGLVLAAEALACTSAIVTAQRSSEGAPLLWKHRDSSFSKTRVEYITPKKGFSYTAIVPDTKNFKRDVYAGINEKGLGIFNTASHDLPEATQEEYDACTLKRVKSFMTLMAYGLRRCSTVDEFEAYLKKTKRSKGFDTNIGIGDATGAVAYFEVWDLGYRRYDVNERSEGFDVRSNFSFAASGKRGFSERRYKVVMKQMKAHSGNFKPQDFLAYSSSYNSIKFGDILANDKPYVCNNHSVARATSVSSVVMVCDSKCPRMLVANGHPAACPAVPVYVQAKNEIPECVHTSKMRVLSDDFRATAYTKKAKKKYQLNKEVVRAVLKVKKPVFDMPQQMPANIKKFNAKIDKGYNKYERKVRKVVNKYAA